MKVYNITGEKIGKGFLPYHLRCVIVDPTGCCKTNLSIDILLGVDDTNPKDKHLFLDFKRLDIISPTCYQKCWDILRELPQIAGQFDLEINFHDDDEDELLGNAVIVYDDCMFSKDHKYISTVFIRGRHYKANVFFLTQNFVEIPKTIRRNMNFLILFKGINESIPHNSRETGLNDLKNIYEKYVKDNFSYLTIDLERKKFYKNFNELITS